MSDPFTAADAANAERAKREALTQHQRARELRRDHRPLPEGSLFDSTTRSQQGLFQEPRQ